MSGLELRSHRFRLEREADWRQFDSLLAKAERGRASDLSDEELIALPILYRTLVSSLSVARATSLDAGLIAYLEGLASRGYFFVYGTRARMGRRLTRFFQEAWPAAVRSLWRETLVSALIFSAAAVLGAVLVGRDADWFGSIMPAGMAQGRDPTASTAFLRGVLYDTHQGQGLSLFATFLFTHNAQIALLAFALGFAFCLPTAALLAQNGLGLGALIALYASRGLGLQLCGWLFIHGATEIFAVILAGAAGFRLGWVIMFPGRLSRLEAASRAGYVTGAVMAGVVLMLFVAGGLEGVGRQVIIDDLARWGIALATLALWAGYFYLPRARSAEGEPLSRSGRAGGPGRRARSDDQALSPDHLVR